jgi:maltose alpha-D-glucosyltransferase/alpha-amylase
VLAFLRTWESQCILVVANLSRFAQHAELTLPAPLRGSTPVELFGRTPFPRVGDGPYALALGPHTLYWFSLEPAAPAAVSTSNELPELSWSGTLEDLLAEEHRDALEAALPAILRTRAWFRGRGRVVQWTEVREVLPVGDEGFVVLVAVDYTEGEPETYVLTLMHLVGPAAEARLTQARNSVLARLRGPKGAEAGLLADGLWDRRFAETMLAFMGRRTARGAAGELDGWCIPQIRRMREVGVGPSALIDRGAHTSVIFGTRFVLRLLRRLEEGPHPDVEIGRYLTEEARFPHVPPLVGTLEYVRSRVQSAVVATLHGFVPSEKDAWTFTTDELSRYFERVLTGMRGATPPPVPAEAVTDLARRETPPEARALVGSYLEWAALIGQRMADLHMVLAAAPGPAFEAEPFSELYQRSLVQSLRNLTRQVLQRLRRRLRDLPEDLRADAQRLAGLEAEIVRRARAALSRRYTGARMRFHGNLHLGQLLYTGRDFVILISEGDATRSLADRRIKRSPLRDVAALLRSFHYVSAHATGRSGGAVRPEDVPVLDPWVRYWRSWVSAAFVRGYQQASAGAAFLPRTPEELRDALNVYLLEKALHELAHELELRPDWVPIPLRGILELVDTAAT